MEELGDEERRTQRGRNGGTKFADAVHLRRERDSVKANVTEEQKQETPTK